MKKAIELSEAHWLYVKAVLMAHGMDKTLIELCGFHYQSAFVHGYKHGAEDASTQD